MTVPVDWDAVARRLGFESEIPMWHGLYTVQGLSMAQLAERFGITVNSIRDSLRRCQIPTRPRGGANNVRRTSHFTKEEMIEIRAEGIAAVARRLSVPYMTLYQRLRRDAAEAGVSWADIDSASRT